MMGVIMATVSYQHEAISRHVARAVLCCAVLC